MKFLIAIKGCERDAVYGVHQAQRDTWIKNVVGADVYFFVGSGFRALRPDEMRLDCPDDYLNLPHKVRAILQWALSRGYDFIFLCDTDTFVMPERLVASGFEKYDLIGLFNGAIGVPNAVEGKYWAWTRGGNGYWLSRRAASLVVEAPYDGDWAEDRFTGQVLGPYFQRGELKAFNHIDYGFEDDGDEWATRITSHRHARLKTEVRWMYDRHRHNVPSPVAQR